MCLAQGPQRSDAGEARTRGPSVSSQALFHWATALPTIDGLLTFLVAQFFVATFSCELVEVTYACRYAQASSYLTSCHSCTNLQQIIYLVSYLRGTNTCRPASARRTVNHLYCRHKAFNPPGNSWMTYYAHKRNNFVEYRSCTNFKLISSFFIYPLISAQIS